MGFLPIKLVCISTSFYLLIFLIDYTLYLKAQRSPLPADILKSPDSSPKLVKHHYLRRCPSFASPFFDFIEKTCAEVQDSVDIFNKKRTGVVIGSANSGNEFLFEQFKAFHKDGLKKISPLFIPYSIHNSVASQLAIHFGFHGVSSGVNCAETSGLEALADAVQYIEQGVVDSVFCGAGETFGEDDSRQPEASCLLVSKYHFGFLKQYKIKSRSLGYGWLSPEEALDEFCRKFGILPTEQLKTFIAKPLSTLDDGEPKDFSSLSPTMYLCNQLEKNEAVKIITVSSESHVHFLEVYQVG